MDEIEKKRKVFSLRLDEQVSEFLKEVAEKEGISESKYAKLIINRFFTENVEQAILDIHADIKGSKLEEKNKKLTMSFPQSDIEILSMLADEFSIPKSRIVSQLIKMYVKREISRIGFSTDSLTALLDATEQLRKVGINFNQLVHGVNIIKLKKNEGKVNDISDETLKSLVQELKKVSEKIDSSVKATQAVIQEAQRLK